MIGEVLARSYRGVSVACVFIVHQVPETRSITAKRDKWGHCGELKVYLK
jgi:hypothetical protein